MLGKTKLFSFNVPTLIIQYYLVVNETYLLRRKNSKIYNKYKIQRLFLPRDRIILCVTF